MLIFNFKFNNSLIKTLVLLFTCLIQLCVYSQSFDFKLKQGRNYLIFKNEGFACIFRSNCTTHFSFKCTTHFGFNCTT